MNRHRVLGIGLAVYVFGASPAPGQAQANRPANGAGVARTPTPIESALLRSLRANPVTAPYPFATEIRGNKVVLRGRVGTKQIHDVAIQTAIALGVPVSDGLLIDTAAAHQVAAMGMQGAYATSGPINSVYGGYGGATTGSLPYTYPPPILGRLDDPFFGFEPPSISYPPWWGDLTNRRLGLQAYPMPPGAAANAPPPPNPGQPGPSVADPSAPTGAIPYGTIDMAIDSRGVATLRGAAPTLAERIAIGQKVAGTPGVTQVVNLISVQAPPANQAPALSDNPPPPPVPADAPRPVAAHAAATIDGPPILPDADPATHRAGRAVAALAGPSVKVKVRDGVADLSGFVPTVYEAMLAYRAAQQTPGVRQVEDRLSFVVPDGSSPNPLTEKGRPEDVEPYLEAQLRRQVGDIAHIDRVRVSGEALDLRGSLSREEDRPRFDAILRSMPILRGFRVTTRMPVSPP